MSQVSCKYSFFSSSLHHSTGSKSKSSSFIREQTLVISFLTGLPQSSSYCCGQERPSSSLPCPGVPFMQSYTYRYSFPRLSRCSPEEFSLGWTKWTHFLFPAYRNELGSGRGQRQVVTAYFGLSPQEVALKRRKTVGILVRDNMENKL